MVLVVNSSTRTDGRDECFPSIHIEGWILSGLGHENNGSPKRQVQQLSANLHTCQRLFGPRVSSSSNDNPTLTFDGWKDQQGRE